MSIKVAVLICKVCGQILPVEYSVAQLQREFARYGEDLFYVGSSHGVTPNVIACGHCATVYLRKCAAFGVDNYTSTLFPDQSIYSQRDHVGGDLTITLIAGGDITGYNKVASGNPPRDCAGVTILDTNILGDRYKLGIEKGGILSINGGPYNPSKEIHRYILQLLDTYIMVSGW